MTKSNEPFGECSKNGIGEPFAPILKAMIDSVAFKKLSNPARVAYLLLVAQRKKAGQIEVCLPYNDAEQFMKRHTFAKAIRQLVELGFIELVKNGGLYGGPNVYGFSERWRGQNG